MSVAEQRLTDIEAYERARTHERTAQRLRFEAGCKLAQAERLERWATKWRGWADDEYGDVPYPGDAR
jgi:hypothetical protein